MNIERTLKLTDEIKEHIRAGAELRDKMATLTKRRNEQARVVGELRKALDAKLEELQKTTESDPDKIQTLKREAVDLSEQHENETGMLDAYKRAVVNMSDELTAEQKYVADNTDRAIKKSIQPVEDRLVSNLLAVIDDLMFSMYLADGPRGPMRIEPIVWEHVRNTGRLREVAGRVREAKRSLLDSVNA